MAVNKGVDYRKQFLTGNLNYIDDITNGDSSLANAIAIYENVYDGQSLSIQWQRSMRWVENILFTTGRHYLDEILVNSLTKTTEGDLAVIRDFARQIPKPTNDILGRYIETNVALLTENRPRPRVIAKSDRSDDQSAAALSELTLEYLWEALDMPHIHRQIARILLVCGVCWLEVSYDPTKPRRISIPETELKQAKVAPAGLPGAPAVPLPIPQSVPKIDPETGEPIYTEQVDYGDITAKIVSPFEMYLPPVHSWGGDDLGWVMREYYTSKSTFVDQYTAKGLSLSKRDGWYLGNLEKLGSDQVNHLPVWWWERLSQTIEGGGSTFYAGSPELWKDYTIVRIFDRKPNAKWPRGRTVMVAGGQVIYDSPKRIGARAYDPRWPDRWHPYIIFRWEPTAATDIHCRSLVTKLLPSLKRINAIDTSMIMWRRTVPMASWVIPKGTVVVEDQWCFPGNARVMTREGMKAIRDIAPGDEVRSDGKFTTVRQLHRNGLRNEFTIISPIYTSELKMTPNHVISILRDNVIQDTRAKDVLKGDYVRIWKHRPKNNPSSIDLVSLLECQEIRTIDGIKTQRGYKTRNGYGGVSYIPRNATIQLTPEVLWLFGLYLAEGSMSKDQISFSLGYHENYLSEKAINIIEKSFGVTPSLYKHENKGTQIVTINNRLLTEMFKILFPGTSKTKKINIDLFESKVNLLPLVAGWLDGDGSFGIYKGRTSFSGTTTSPDLASQLHLILLDSDINSRLYKNNRGWRVDLGDNCSEVSSYSVRFQGKVGSKSKFKDNLIFDKDYVYLKIKNVTTKQQSESIEVFDLTTDAGYFNYHGIIVHNSGGSGNMFEFDPRRTAQHKPEPVYPPPFPEAVLAERQMMLQQIEAIAGTEEILRGQRPAGVTSAAMLDTLRKQALASRSAIIQDWDESLQKEGSALLIEVIKHVRKDPRYAERLRILAREKTSRLSIAEFSGTDLSDNVIVKVDTVSLALSSKEAREARALEFARYVPALMSIPYLGLRQAIVEELGFGKSLTPQGPDIERAKRMISWIRSENFERVVPFIEDDPYIFYELLVKELKDESFWDMNDQQRLILLKLIDAYKQQITQREEAQMKMAMMQAQLKGGGQGGGPPEGQ